MINKVEKISMITSLEELKDYINNKQNKHKLYCHYSSFDNIEKIFKSRIFWVSSINNCNDIIEKESFDNSEEYFCLCFSSLNSENIPMWYLYGDIDGEGARITFKTKNFNEFIENIELLFLEYKDNELKDKFIINNDDYEIECGDVIYGSYVESNNKYRIKYNSENVSNFKGSEIEVKNMFKGFYKEIPWFYEKEFRILIHVKNKEIIDKINSDKEKYKLGIEIQENISNNIEVFFAPSVTDEKIKKSKILSKFIGNKSKYHGKIQFKIRRNK